MRLRDLLGAPQLRMDLLHGDAAALERAVDRVCVTDMPDPRPFVTAGALVCTGLVWRSSPADADRYIGLLARAGAVGVVAGQALHGYVPDDVLAACAHHELALLSAPQSVPFSRIIEYMAERAAETRWQRERFGLRRLMSEAAGGTDIGDLLADVAAEHGFSTWLLTATGAVVAGTAPLRDDEIDRILSTALTAPRLPAIAPGGITVHPVGSRDGDRIAAWYLMVRAAAADPHGIQTVGADLAAVAELYRARQAEHLRAAWDVADRTVDLTAAPMTGPRVALVCDLYVTSRADHADITPGIGERRSPAAARVNRSAIGAATETAARSAADGNAADAAAATVAPDHVAIAVEGAVVRGSSASATTPSDSEGAVPAARAVVATAAARRATGPGGVAAAGTTPPDPCGAVAVAKAATGAAGGTAAVAGSSAGTVHTAARGMIGAAAPTRPGQATVPPPTRDALRAALHDVLPGIVTGIDRDGRVIGYAPGSEAEVAGLLRRGLGRLRPVLGGAGIAVGVSAPQGAEALSGAFAAAAAVASAEAGEASVRIADIDSAAGLFTAIPNELQRRFAERVLGPVVEYDRKTGAGLVRTLEVFLGCEGSWRQAAERMHLHLNTVRYRIGRVEELTGRDLGRLDDRLDLYLAVRTLGGHTAPV
ncbi:PucR family transcriptional regulator [Nocardia otitidiscaviarum]|uniref:PucR family transcriptional regulator n=1 Tax=Nocardia otitidiscaviarum TaxID=1823 RepID=A0A516NQ80_9NOCA|nr:PucR family transcriptional regulator [Nocardia otitidiscaviarum]MCP9623642.1 PucR family transcriptional regulator [Nocardia otitidiscaviarum]QDP81049.1 PucR family transcriptional regulator [Nocardia otitidiscaviarum]